MSNMRSLHIIFSLLQIASCAAFPAVCFADTILLDDFSTGLTFGGGTFYNSSNQQIPSGSGNSYSPWGGNGGGTLNLNPGVTARWVDTDVTNGILGNTRTAEVKNASGTSRSSITMVGGINGNANINSPVENVMCLTCFTYSFAPIDVMTHHIFYITFVGLDATARGNLQARLHFSDGANTAIATLDTSAAVIGKNRFDLMGALNWNSINRYAVTSAMIEFTSSTNGVDFVVDSLMFSTNPEPGTFGVLSIATLLVAGLSIQRRRNRSQRAENSD
jgi:hypothetical protein